RKRVLPDGGKDRGEFPQLEGILISLKSNYAQMDSIVNGRLFGHGNRAARAICEVRKWRVLIQKVLYRCRSL
ncbi:MAG: hypothetical protein WAK57_01960, partial [Desulfobacterales bacterium]